MTIYFDVCLADDATPDQCSVLGAAAVVRESVQTLVVMEPASPDEVMNLLRRVHDLGLELGDVWCGAGSSTSESPTCRGGRRPRSPRTATRCLIHISGRLGPMMRAGLRSHRVTQVCAHTRLLLPADPHGGPPLDVLRRADSLGLQVTALRAVELSARPLTRARASKQGVGSV